MSHHSINSLRNVVHDYIKINFIWFVSSRVKGMLHCNNIWMKELLHYLELSVFIALVLINLFDGDCFASLCNSSLVYYSKWPISNNSLCIVGQRRLCITFLYLPFSPLSYPSSAFYLPMKWLEHCLSIKNDIGNLQNVRRIEIKHLYDRVDFANKFSGRKFSEWTYLLHFLK